MRTGRRRTHIFHGPPRPCLWRRRGAGRVASQCQCRGRGEDCGSAESVAVHEVTAQLQASMPGSDQEPGRVGAIEQQHHGHGVGRRRNGGRSARCGSVSHLDVEVSGETGECVRWTQGRTQQSPALLAFARRAVAEPGPGRPPVRSPTSASRPSAAKHRSARQPAGRRIARVQSGHPLADVDDQGTEVDRPIRTMDGVLVLDPGPTLGSAAPHDLPVERPAQRGALPSGVNGSWSSGWSRRRRSRPSSMRWSAARSTTLSWIV